MKGSTNATRGPSDVVQNTSGVSVLDVNLQNSTDSQPGLMSAADHSQMTTDHNTLSTTVSRLSTCESKVTLLDGATGNIQEQIYSLREYIAEYHPCLVIQDYVPGATYSLINTDSQETIVDSGKMRPQVINITSQGNLEITITQNTMVITKAIVAGGGKTYLDISDLLSTVTLDDKWLTYGTDSLKVGDDAVDKTFNALTGASITVVAKMNETWADGSNVTFQSTATVSAGVTVAFPTYSNVFNVSKGSGNLPIVGTYRVNMSGGGGGGGGGGGARSYASNATTAWGGDGGDGGKGYSLTETVTVTDTSYTATVGTGGTRGAYGSGPQSGKDGGTGGTTSISGAILKSCAGGTGGKGGKYGTPGNNGTDGANGTGGTGSKGGTGGYGAKALGSINADKNGGYGTAGTAGYLKLELVAS